MSTPDGLSTSLARLLDAAYSEAKRRGHARVTPAHVAVVVGDETGTESVIIGAQTRDSVDAYLAALPRTFETPVLADETLEMLRECAKRADPLAALTEELRVRAATLGEAVPDDGSGAPEPVGPTAARPEAFTVPERISDCAIVASTSSPVVDRQDVVHRLLAMLTARDPQTPLVVAPEGQGRTSLAQCLAARLADPEYTGALAGWPVVRVRPEGVIGGGRWDSLKAVLAACRGAAVVYMDDVEVLLALGGGRIDSDSLAVLRSALHDPDLHVVMSVAAEFVDRLQVADTEFFDELDRVDLLPLSDDQVMAIAQSAAVELAAYHGVEIGPEVIAAAAAPPRQIDTKGHPSLAVSRLDRAAAAARLTPERIATTSDLGSAVAGQQYLSFDVESTRSALKQVVLGQDDAIDRVVERLALTRASLDTRPERPDGVFLFAGPTGTGKTALALALADQIFGTQEALIRIDMSELSEQHSVSKLIGSPPGYVGSTEPDAWMTTKIRRRPQSVLLLDEIEKAHPLIWNTFLQVFDAGRLTDSQGRVADFRDVIVVLTTNIGAEFFADRNATGFLSGEDTSRADEKQVVDEIQRWMRPELLNRLDGVLVFHPLSPQTLRGIVVNQVTDSVTRLATRGWSITYDDAVIDVLCVVGYDKKYGARPLLRALEEKVLGPIGRLPAGPVHLAVVDGSIVATAGAA